jgi:hypothetical protein
MLKISLKLSQWNNNFNENNKFYLNYFFFVLNLRNYYVQNL